MTAGYFASCVTLKGYGLLLKALILGSGWYLLQFDMHMMHGVPRNIMQSDQSDTPDIDIINECFF